MYVYEKENIARHFEIFFSYFEEHDEIVARNIFWKKISPKHYFMPRKYYYILYIVYQK